MVEHTGGAKTRMDKAKIQHVSQDQAGIDQELNSLFEQYRMTVPDPEASANFVPDLWRKIEARRFLLARLKKLTQVFVTAAAAICLLLGIVLLAPAWHAPVSNDSQAVRGNYVDVLADANPTENLSPLGIRVDYTEPNDK